MESLALDALQEWDEDDQQMGATQMAGENHGAVLRGIERIFNQGSLTGLSEGQLLRQFATGDRDAFEALVTRHGPMVLGVCRRLLSNHRDVEDAFQATFLVLLQQGRCAARRRGDQPLAARRGFSSRRPHPVQRGPAPGRGIEGRPARGRGTGVPRGTDRAPERDRRGDPPAP